VHTAKSASASAERSQKSSERHKHTALSNFPQHCRGCVLPHPCFCTAFSGVESGTVPALYDSHMASFGQERFPTTAALARPHYALTTRETAIVLHPPWLYGLPQRSCEQDGLRGCRSARQRRIVGGADRPDAEVQVDMASSEERNAIRTDTRDDKDGVRLVRWRRRSLLPATGAETCVPGPLSAVPAARERVRPCQGLS